MRRGQPGQRRYLRRGGILATTLLLAAASLTPAQAGTVGTAADRPAVGRLGADLPSTDAPMYRGSAAGNHVVTTGQNLAVTWTSPFLKSIAVDAIPYGNNLYVSGMVTFQYDKLYNGSEFQAPFYALDLRTGAIKWQIATPNWHTRGPVVVGGTVYLGVGNSWARSGQPVDWDTVTRGTGANGVYAYDAATGATKWAFPTAGAVHNTPLYSNGVVYAVTGDRTFYAINATTGKQLWKLAIPSYDSVSSPILVGNLVYFGGAHPYAVYAIDVTTRKIAWRTGLPGVFGATDDCTPAVANGLVYIEGVTSPTAPISGSAPVSPTYTVLPATGTPVQRNLYALNATTGQIEWTFHEGLGHTPYFYAASTPTVVGDTVYFGSNVTDSFYAVNAYTGALRWSYTVGPWSLPNGIGESGTIANGVVWTATSGGLLLGLRASDGAVLVKKRLKATPINAGSPLVVDNTLIMGSQAGRVVAFSIPQLLAGK